MRKRASHFLLKFLNGLTVAEKNLDAKKEDFVKIMLRKIVDFVKEIFWAEPMVSTVNTLKDAMRELEVARNHFENCDPEFITAAIFELNAAECRLDAARRCAV